MKPMQQNPARDLKRLAPVEFDPHGITQRYRELADENSPEALDMRVLAAAKTGKRALRPWLAAVASVSVLTLSALMVWQSRSTGALPHGAEVVAESTQAQYSDAALPGAALPGAAKPEAGSSPMARSEASDAAALGASASSSEVLAQSAGHADLERRQRSQATENSLSAESALADAPASPAAAPVFQAAPTPAPLAAASAPPARAREAAVASRAPVAPEHKLAGPLDPDAWLAQIRALLQEGHPAEARVSLRAWQERYPRRTVPEDLQLLLEPRLRRP